MNQNTGRSSLIAIAGGYVLYLAYELLKSLIDNAPTTMPRVVQILAIVFLENLEKGQGRPGSESSRY